MTYVVLYANYFSVNLGGGEIQFAHSFFQLTFSEGKYGSPDTLQGIVAQGQKH